MELPLYSDTLALQSPLRPSREIKWRGKIALMRPEGHVYALCDADAGLSLSALSLDPKWCCEDVSRNVMTYAVQPGEALRSGDLLAAPDGECARVLSEWNSDNTMSRAHYDEASFPTCEVKVILETRLKAVTSDPGLPSLRTQQQAALEGLNFRLMGALEQGESLEYVTKAGLHMRVQQPQQLSDFLRQTLTQHQFEKMALSKDDQRELTRLCIHVKPYRPELRISVRYLSEWKS